MHIIAGLGNPGTRYHMTRHNVGFETIDFLATQYRLTHFRSRHKALISEGMIQGKKVMLVKPQTYMNNSGESLAEILSYYRADPGKLIVIYDDIDLDPESFASDRKEDREPIMECGPSSAFLRPKIFPGSG